MKRPRTLPLIFFLISFTYLASAQGTTPKTVSQSHGKIVTNGTRVWEVNDNYNFKEFEKFNAYVKKHIKPIPGLNGQVMISFTHEKDGSITHIKIEKGLTKAADAEALRLIRSYPRWEPNLVDGKPQSGKLQTGIVFGTLKKI